MAERVRDRIANDADDRIGRRRQLVVHPLAVFAGVDHERSRQKENFASCKSTLGKGQESRCEMNPNVYRVLANLNEALRVVARSLDVLKDEKLLTPQLSELRELTTEQLRAEINQAVTINLHNREIEIASQFQQERLRLEERMKES